MRPILFIAYQFPPDARVGAKRSAKFVKYLPEFGYLPLVLTSGGSDCLIPRDETLNRQVDGSTINRCPGHEALWEKIARRRYLYRFLRLLVRPDPLRWAWLPQARRMALRIARQANPAAIYTSVNPFSSVVLGSQLKQDLKIPWVVDYRDPWTDDANAVWPSRWHYQWECRQERRALAHADAIVVVTPTMQDLLAKRYPEYASKIHVIPNGFDRDDFSADGSPDAAGPLSIGFTGSLAYFGSQPVRGQLGALGRWWLSRFSYAHTTVDQSTNSPYYLLHAVRALLDDQPALEHRLRLRFTGQTFPQNQQLIRSLGLEQIVEMKGLLPHQEANRLLLESDVLFLPLMSFPPTHRNYIYTSKVFEYLAARRPILAAVPPGDLRDLIHRSQAGWCVDPKDVPALKQFLAELIVRKAEGKLALQRDEAYLAQFDRRVLTSRLAALLDSLCPSPPS